MSDRKALEGAVWALDAAFRDAARLLAGRLGWPLAAPGTPGLDHCLLVDQGLRLVDCSRPRGASLRVLPEQLCEPPPPVRYREARLADEGLLRAVGVRRGQRPHVVDATAGLGADAMLLVRAGCPVQLIERSPLLALMLEQGLARLRQLELPPWATLPQPRLHAGEAVALLPMLDGVDVVTLDPMYRQPGRKAAASGAMQLLDRILSVEEEPTSDATLFATALACARSRVVVKRPLRAPPLVPEPAPHHGIAGKSTRFDVYLV